MYFNKIFTVSLLLLWTGYTVEGYGSGAPASACTNMIPNHGMNSPLSGGDQLFALTVTDQGDGDYLVTLGALNDGDFKGFFIQARTNATGSTPIGSWDVSVDSQKVKTRPCPVPGASPGANGITHKNKYQKSSISAVWTADGADTTGLFFTASVVDKYSDFYIGITADLP